MKQLTHRQQQILDLIKHSLKQTGMPPTRAEICEQFGFRSTFAAEKHLQALAKKQVIELIPGSSRGIRLLKRRGIPRGLPMVGHVAAGEPILAEEYIEDHYSIDPRLFRPSADYLLRVHGMSMKNAGILDGDLLAVHRTPDAENGQIVVARLEGEVTVKRFKRLKYTIKLLPENEDFEPIVVDKNSGEFSIEGIAVGCIRTGYAD